MSSLYANMINETQKILQKKKTIAFLVISGLIPIGAAASFVLFQNRLGIFAVGSAGFPILILGLFTTFLLPLFVFSAVADQFSGEIGEKTIKMTLTRPITRFQVFFSKILSMVIFIVINLGIIYIVATLSGLYLAGDARVSAGLLEGLTAYITAIVPMLFLVIEAAFLAQFFRSGGGALTTCIFIYLAAKIVPILSPAISKVNPFFYTDWYMMWLGSSVGAGRLLNTFLLLLSYCLILFAGGFYLFDRKDF